MSRNFKQDTSSNGSESGESGSYFMYVKNNTQRRPVGPLSRFAIVWHVESQDDNSPPTTNGIPPLLNIRFWDLYLQSKKDQPNIKEPIWRRKDKFIMR